MTTGRGSASPAVLCPLLEARVTPDYAEHLIAARKALNACEKAVNAGNYQSAQHQAELATFKTIAIEQWCDTQLRNAKC